MLGVGLAGGHVQPPPSTCSYAATVCAPQRSQVNSRCTVSRATSAERHQRGPVGEQRVDAVGQRAHVASGHQLDAAARGCDLLRTVLAAAADRRNPARHRLDVSDAECLVDARHHEQRRRCARRRSPRSLGSWPRNSTRSATPSDAASSAQALALGAVADDHVAQRRDGGRAAAPAPRSRRRGACARPDDRRSPASGDPMAPRASAARRRRGARRDCRARRARHIAARCPRCWRARAGRAAASSRRPSHRRPRPARRGRGPTPPAARNRRRAPTASPAGTA